MNSFLKYSLLIVLILSFWACKQQSEPVNANEENRTKIEMTTNYGTMIIELYNETPLHRDNFINLTTNNAYDSLLFHRVINNFMIQGGDPDSRKAMPNDTLGEGDAPYVVKAEFNMDLFHKKGALAAARDDNPEKASSGMQFYIVQGKVFNDSVLNVKERNINRNKAWEYYKNISEKKSLYDSIQYARNNRNMVRYRELTDSILGILSSEESFNPYVMPEKYRKVYKSQGGTPHLDQGYTVFGEVVEGLNIIDSIAPVETNPMDRPINDVRVLSVKVLK